MQIKTLCAALLLVSLSSVAAADDLAAALKARQDQDYARAHQLLGKLAQAGNREAQLQLGQMYGFGEGVAEDAMQAEAWLAKAQAAGQAGADQALRLLQQRQLRKADIEFYRTAYTGADLAYGKQGCTEPAFANAPDSDEGIRQMKARMAEWAACFNGFAQGLAAALPAGKLIPADVMALMSVAEQQQARSAMEQAYAQVLRDGEAVKQQVFAAHDTWLARTEVWANVERRQKWEQVVKWQPAVERVRYQSYAQLREPTPVNNNGNRH